MKHLLKLVATSAILLFSSSAFALDIKADTSGNFMIGPLRLAADGTAVTGATITQAEVQLSKNGGAFAQKNDATSCTHDTGGMYSCPYNATDTNTEGTLTVITTDAGGIAPPLDVNVLEASYYDLKYGGDCCIDPEQIGLLVEAPVDTVTAQDELVLGTATSGTKATNNDAYNDLPVHIKAGTEWCRATVDDYVGSTTTVHLDAACANVTVATSDIVRIYASASAAQVAAVKAKTDGLNFTGNNVHADTKAVNAVNIGGIGESGDPFTPFYTDASVTAQADLDLMTGADGATLATSQPNYAPATASALSTHDGKLDTVDGIVDDILLDTAEIANLNDLSQADVRTSVGLASANLDTQLGAIDDALTIGEPTGPPGWTDPIGDWVAWMGAWSRNEVNQTATTKTLRNDSDDADLATCGVSDDGTVSTRAECQ